MASTFLMDSPITFVFSVADESSKKQSWFAGYLCGKRQENCRPAFFNIFQVAEPFKHSMSIGRA